MTIREVKEMDRQIAVQERKRERLKVDDSISGRVEKIQQCTNEIAKLKAARREAVNSLSTDIYEERCIYLFLVMGYTWKKIAQIVNNRAEMENTMRKMASRYQW